MTGKELRNKRRGADITGRAVSSRIGMSAAKYSDIENGHVIATREEMQRATAAIEEITRDRESLAQLASEAGLRLDGVRL